MTVGARVIWLVEVEAYIDGTGLTTLRYSDERFATLPSDTPANTSYKAVVMSPGSFSRAMFAGGLTFGRSETGYGEILLDNSNGSLDALKDYGYGRQVTIKSITTTKRQGVAYADAVTRFVGVVAYVEAGFDEVSLVVRDELGELAIAYMDALFDGTSTGATGIEGNGNIKGQSKPAAIGGFVRNLTGALANYSKETYAFRHAPDGTVLPSDSVAALRNGGETYDLSGDNRADLAALFAATITTGEADTCLAESLYRTSGSVTSALTADVYVSPEVTNLLTYSEALDNAAWTKTRASISANAAEAPDGAVSADKAVEDSSAASTHTASRSATVSASAAVVGSIYLRAAERTRARVTVSGASGSVYVDVDLSAGTLGTPAVTGTYSGPTASIEAAGSYYRVSVLCTTATDTSVALVLSLADGAGSTSYDGDGASGLYAWGAMLVEGTAAKPYIPTAAATVTRRCEATAARAAEQVLADKGFTIEPTSVLELDRKAPYTVAYYVQDSLPTLDLSQALLESVGATLLATTTGTFRAVRFEQPSGTVRKAIALWEVLDRDDVLPLTLLPVDDGNGVPFYRTVVLYGRNWTEQDAGQLTGSVVTEDERQAYGQSWLRASAEDVSVLTKHPKAGEAVITTYLDTASDAEAEATRRLAFLKGDKTRFSMGLDPGRAVWDSDGETPLDVGDRVTFSMDRYGLSSPVDFLVIGRDDRFDQNVVYLDIVTSSAWVS